MLALEPVNTDPVHTTSTPVFPHTLPRPLQITRVMNLTDQRVRLPHLHTFPRYPAHQNTIPAILSRAASVIASATISPAPPTHPASPLIPPFPP